MSKGTAKVTLLSDEEFLITREFEAPRALVYRAWTDPELVRRWWAGQQGALESVTIDLRVGGSWRYVMGLNGGAKIAFHGTFREIVPDARLVNTEVYEPAGDSPDAGEASGAVVTTSFSDAGEGRTALRMVTRMPDRASRDALLDSGMETGMQEQMDALEVVAGSLR